MLKRFKFKLIFPSIKDFKSQQKRETKTKNKSRTCLLKSKTFAVQGKKKIGIKKTKKYIDAFVIFSNIFFTPLEVYHYIAES